MQMIKIVLYTLLQHFMAKTISVPESSTSFEAMRVLQYSKLKDALLANIHCQFYFKNSPNLLKAKGTLK